jgi:hypothetical protein
LSIIKVITIMPVYVVIEKETALVLGLITMIGVSISPLGWLLMALGADIGGTLAFFTRRWALDTTSGEDIP